MDFQATSVSCGTSRMRSLCLAFGILICGGNLSALQQTASPPSATTESAEVHLGKGYDALKEDNYDEATRQFRAALDLDPTLVLKARFPLAIALFEMHKFSEARQQLESVR